MTYILLILFLTRTEHVEFNTKAGCKTAANIVKYEYRQSSEFQTVICVSKDTGNT
jgi:hypothetical protein